jgi:hypothetical protein
MAMRPPHPQSVGQNADAGDELLGALHEGTARRSQTALFAQRSGPGPQQAAGTPPRVPWACFA